MPLPQVRKTCVLTAFLAQYAATQINTKINEVQKQIGAKKKAKQNADDLMKQKIDFEKEKKALVDSAAEKELTLKRKIGTIGNLVHDSVPVKNDEVAVHTRHWSEWD